MMDNLICSIPYTLIEHIKLSHMWLYIYLLSLTNKNIYLSIKTQITPKYIELIKKNYNVTTIILPSNVMSFIYPNITYSNYIPKFIVPNYKEIEERYLSIE